MTAVLYCLFITCALFPLPVVYLCIFMIYFLEACVDEDHFEEDVLSAGQQDPPYRLNCSLGSIPHVRGDPRPQLTWLKDCQLLGAQQGNDYLEFANISVDAGGNYTCLQPGNNTASFTVRLVVKGERSSCSSSVISAEKMQLHIQIHLLLVFVKTTNKNSTCEEDLDKVITYEISNVILRNLTN